MKKESSVIDPKQDSQMTENSNTAKDKRVNDILLGPIERKALQYFAKTMPSWVNSDMLTTLGFLASCLILFAYIMAGKGELKGNWWLMVSSFGFFLNWFGDSLDGTLARYRHQERPNFGYFIDHSIDGLTAAAIFIGLGMAGMSDLIIAMLALTAYLLLIISVSLKTHVTGVFEMTSIKIGPTEVRVMAILFNTYVFFAGNPVIHNFPGLGDVAAGSLVVGGIGLLMALYFVYQTFRTGSQLAKEDEYALFRRQLKAAKKAAKAERKLAKKAAKEERKLQKKTERESQTSPKPSID